MKLIALLGLGLVLCASAALADTYVVQGDKAGGGKHPQLAAKQKAGKCFYASKQLNLGDTLVIDDGKIVQVCAGAPGAPAFFTLDQDAAERVVKALPAKAQ